MHFKFNWSRREKIFKNIRQISVSRSDRDLETFVSASIVVLRYSQISPPWQRRRVYPALLIYKPRRRKRREADAMDEGGC